MGRINFRKAAAEHTAGIESRTYGRGGQKIFTLIVNTY